MKSKTILPSDQPQFFFVIYLVFLIIIVPISVCWGEEDGYSDCKGTFDCGDIKGVGYPFWGSSRPEYCGVPGMELKCSTDTNSATIEMNRTTYRVLSIDSWSARTLRIARMDFSNGICGQQQNTTIDFNLFNYTNNDVNLTLFYGCSSSYVPFGTATPSIVTCNNGYGVPTGAVYFNITRGGVGSDPIETCQTSVVVTVLGTTEPGLGTSASGPTITDAINQGFEVEWTADVINSCVTCRGSGGSCGYNWTSYQPICFHQSSKFSLLYHKVAINFVSVAMKYVNISVILLGKFWSKSEFQRKTKNSE
ncbi:LEAF RUST 10 DISEASE-RESISTANCE LOCUS RECEPTOR-LIKE PROTEIN KINASE-like 2.7 [Telopea speciosissima]|uniref:LEAF RUST 10 DISEASE-RESISTANCE LOCUS RECEPTOR-LIKE PROTEIN KINASE-like 2.7 n=1 Tax=Telopea speciosissima TaxID=54955 RepID=UPI001CC6018B|nr:LEAF RUST 10 DISEASE-RESISTANCE LOCUS RECEPTOR-LIKE PROTEIN KINASE-like 2.7 [Telopea speciosissima]